jgi:hypothetical protein
MYCKKSSPVFAIAMKAGRKCRNLTAVVVFAAWSVCGELIGVL